MPQAPAVDPAAIKRPLVVDLDGTLIRSDLFFENLFGFVGLSPFEAYKIPLWLLNGKAALKRKLAESSEIDVATLPYAEAVLACIHKARMEGRRVYLASASDELLVRAVALHLGLFDGWFSSDGVTNLSGSTKAAVLVSMFGEGNFDYIGNAEVDFDVWKHAATALYIGPSPRLQRRLTALNKAAEVVIVEKSNYAWVRLLRPIQWAKNALIGVALLTAHKFNLQAVLLILIAVASFSACASAVYIINDLVDIKADRAHPSKRKRPFASGEVSFLSAAIVGTLCLVVAFLAAAAISLKFIGVLVLYLATTTAYSLILKRKMLIDVVTLAGLYTIRVLAGAVAINVHMSEWLITFSIFIFLSLALIKRYSELIIRFDGGLSDPTNRNYKKDDLPVVSSLAAASGYCSIVVLSLYVTSDAVRGLYANPSMLWLTCPLMIYWISRMLMLSHRRLMTDDPIIFAVKDKISWATAALIIVIGVLAAL